LAGQAEEAAGAAGDDSAGAKDAAVAAEARATRAEKAIEAAEGEAARAERAAATAAGHADRSAEGAGAADRHAAHAAGQAAEVDDHVRRMAEAADAAGRGAAEAQHAAASAVAAAELARRSAEEADRITRAAEEAARGRVYEAPAAVTRFRGRHAASRANGSPRRSQREPRPGFDDAGQPMATTELNGSFRELNRRFSELVGYSEEDFQAAVWPPVMDRANLPKHRERMELLREGRIDSADFSTGYVHAQGLLVPLTGTITLVEEAGKPDHFLLSVDAQS
jgi:PAS domain S-box-containing protein